MRFVLQRTKKIKGIHLESDEKDEIHLNAESVSKMKNLRHFVITMPNIKWSGNIDRVSNELRWFEWWRCPIQLFSSNFHPHKLVKLHISNNPHMTRLWDGCKVL